MTFEGTLDQFSLPEILHLLEYAGKTGELALSGSGRSAVVRVTDGRVAAADRDSSRLGLARRLVGSGQVGDADVAAAAEGARDEAGFLEALDTLGAIGAEQLRAARREHTLDAVFDLMRRPAGAFSFSPTEAANADLDLAVDDVVAEVRQRLSAYDDARGLLPPADSTVGLAPALAEDALLHPGEWTLLPLLDGQRTIAELAELTGRGEYAVTRAVAGLVHRGLAVAGAGPPTPADLARRVEILRRLEGGPSPAVARPAPPPVMSAPVMPARAEPLPTPPAVPQQPHPVEQTSVRTAVAVVITAPDPAALRLIRQGVSAR